MGGSFMQYRIRQVAFHVKDARKAAAAHSAAFGSGPFLVIDHVPLNLARYRGQPGVFDHTSAYGQWGDVMVELVQVHSSEPSVFSDLYPDGRTGFHHIALVVDDLAKAMKDFEAQGFAEGFYGEAASGINFAMMDAVEQHGHFIELYASEPRLLEFYERIRMESLQFDGTDPVRNY
ncbi:VOC family protein [Paraburkholderia sp. BR14374]|uniref:VOC family protein n=1 Tax=Paraburkholderia sp. BR14374 TaxID=3237007 RepID=UPI0034CFC077